MKKIYSFFSEIVAVFAGYMCVLEVIYTYKTRRRTAMKKYLKQIKAIKTENDF